MEQIIRLITLAQREKANKLKLDKRISDMKEQLKLLEQASERKGKMLKNLQPKIVAGHRTILKNRRKFINLNQNCVKIGKHIHGPNYKYH